MFGTIDIKARPLRIAHLVDPNRRDQVRSAIRISSTLWGGAYFPIVPLYTRMPATWREGPIKPPSAREVALGYLNAFDPDVLIQHSRSLPSYVANLTTRTVKPADVWHTLREENNLTPSIGIGVFELCDDIFEQYFKYKAKYPVRLVIPRFPVRQALFWASLFGEYPDDIRDVLKQQYGDPLDIKEVEFRPTMLGDIRDPGALFPRRITDHEIDGRSRSSFRRSANVYFLDAGNVPDIIDFWNLRAIGRSVIPVPKHMQQDPQLRELVVSFLKAHRRHWPHNPTVCDFASMIPARSCTMEELQNFAATLNYHT